MALSGRATADGTEQYKKRFPGKDKGEFYRILGDRWVSSLGLGTYLGAPTDEVDEGYRHAIETALDNGINLIDTAGNYRFQRSDRLIGDTLKRLVDQPELERDQVVVATKGGFVPFDGEQPEDPLSHLQSTYVEPGIATEDDFTNDGHCMTPDYIEYQVHNSLNNLNLETIDLFYVHNPETQFAHRSHEDVYDQLEDVFELLEKMVDDGLVASYGVASWDGLRVAPEQNHYLKLDSVLERAVRAGGEDHHFDAVQMPFNFGMPEASTRANQPVNEQPMTPLEACRELGLSVMSSASIMQGKIVDNLPERIREHFDEFNNDVHRALQFTRSAPGVTASLVGMSDPDHVKQNLKLARHKPYDEQTFRDRFLETVEEE
jgi:aryl-alcohol dehydrogenase-like predicted oxidoreductase